MLGGKKVMSFNAIYQIFEVTTVIFGTLIVQQYISGFFESRSKKFQTFIGYALFCIGLSFLSLFFNEPIILASFTVAGVFLLEFLLYEGQKSSKIFSAFFFAILMITSDAICAGMLSIGGDINLSDIHSHGMNRSLGIVISKIVQIFLVKISAAIVKWRTDGKNKVDIKYIVPLLLCQIFSIILSYNIFMEAFDIDGIMSVQVFLSISMVMYINFIIFWYYDRIISAYEYKRQKELTETKYEYQKKYYHLLEEHQKDIEALSHDIGKHISAVTALYGNNFIAESEQYINKLNNTLKDIPKVLRTSDSIINTLIMSELRKAKNENIEVQLDINFSKTEKIDSIDLCVLLGNTLENAIEACAALSSEAKRVIDLHILQDGSLILIDIINPYDPENKKISQNKRKHGYGLKNVRKVVNKYSGDIEIKNTDNVFQVSMVIP